MDRPLTCIRIQIFLIIIFLLAIFGSAHAANCSATTHEGDDYTVCVINPANEHVRLFLNDESGKPFRHFSTVERTLKLKSETLIMAMNGGMYHRDQSPVGLYVENGTELQQLSTRPGPGNFHMLPNGVFYIWHAGGKARAGVLSTDEYQRAVNKDTITHATQSGPMLVINNELHPRFIQDSDSLKRRNGVGIRADGTVVFAISEGAVNFYNFATLFRDKLKTPQALYLDGTISRLFAPSLGRHDYGAAMGPIIGVVVKTPQRRAK